MSLLKNKKFTSVHDVADINGLVKKALAYKANPLQDAALGAGKKMGLLFLNPSLRTRLSTQIAAKNLGMEAIVFNVDKEGWQLEFAEGAVMNGNKSEHIKEAAAVLGQYFDVLAMRSFPSLKNRDEDYSEFFQKEFMRYADKPFISMESATLHPLQSLADLVTMIEISAENKIKKPKVVMAWAPHVKPLPHSVPNSFAEWATAWNAADVVIANPEGYDLSEVYIKGATITHNLSEALQEADFVYVKSWSSYEKYGQLFGNHADWLLDNKKLKLTNNAKIMHCLPVRRNVELSDEILDGNSSVVIQEAANRVWAAQAVISELIG